MSGVGKGNSKTARPPEKRSKDAGEELGKSYCCFLPIFGM
jgi:hypothetical protein